MLGKRVLIVYHPRRAQSEAVARQGLQWCQAHGLEASLLALGTPVSPSSDLVVAVGGDGTFLRVAAALYPHETPILGIKVGGLGFLTACEGEGLAQALGLFFSGQARLERRFRLAALRQDREVGTALNEVAFQSPTGMRAVRLALEVEGEPVLSLVGDGLLVATPTGSTAYALAAGGPIVHPQVESLVVVPLAPHALGLRPVVLPAHALLRVRALSPLGLYLDGEEAGRLEPGETGEIRRAEAATVLVRLSPNESVFARLKGLGWPN